MKLALILFAAALSVSSCAKTDADRDSSKPTAPTPAAKDSSQAGTAEAPPPVPAAGGKESAIQNLGKLSFTILKEPMELPPIRVPALDGKTLDLEDFRGSYVLLNFWATWCPPCRAEMPSMQKLHDRFKDAGLTVLAISVGEATDTVASFLDRSPYSFPIGLDPQGELGSVFASRGIPTTYLVDREGKAVAGIIGSREWYDEQTIAVFESLTADPR